MLRRVVKCDVCGKVYKGPRATQQLGSHRQWHGRKGVRIPMGGVDLIAPPVSEASQDELLAILSGVMAAGTQLVNAKAKLRELQSRMAKVVI